MKSNDTLLCHLVATDEMIKGEAPKLKLDELVFNPTHIDVATNEVVYIHFVHSNTAAFNIEITTPTNVTVIKSNNTLNNNCNTIIKAMGNIRFKTGANPNFYVQFLRILY